MKMFGVKEGTLTIPAGKVDYICFGKGKKPLVLLQGLNTRGIWGAGLGLAWMYRCFGKDYRVWLFDRRANLPEEITVRELAADTAAAMAAVGIQGAHILGVSQGGMIAQYLAIEHPDLVEKLVLAVTAYETNETIADSIQTWVSMTEAGDWKGLVADMTERMYSAEYAKRYTPLLPLLTLLQKPKDPNRFLTLARACLTCDTTDLLVQLRCPVMVIGGANDLVVGGHTAEELARKLDCPLYLYENLGHAAYEEAPDFNSRVLAFFQNETQR